MWFLYAFFLVGGVMLGLDVAKFFIWKPSNVVIIALCFIVAPVMLWEFAPGLALALIAGCVVGVVAEKRAEKKIRTRQTDKAIS